MTDTPVVLLVMGSPRSGSTLAGLAIGQRDDAFNGGEIMHIWERGFLFGHKCGCGLPFLDCPTWQRITARAGLTSENAPALLAALKEGQRSQSLVPWRRAGARIPDTLLEGMRNLYNAIGAETGAKVIVDSSKHPSYARLLVEILGRDRIHVLHLVRDPRGTAFSSAKSVAKRDSGVPNEMMTRRSAGASARSWVKVQLSSRKAGAMAGSYTVCRYEDLAERGFSVLQPALAKIPGLAPLETEADNKVLVPGVQHTISGNPLRATSEPIRFVPDMAWKTELGWRRHMLVTSITGPLLPRYGYEFWPHS